MTYAIFKCATMADPTVKHSQDCTVMIRLPIEQVSRVSHKCKWCQAGTAYYADRSLQRSREELKR